MTISTVNSLGFNKPASQTRVVVAMSGGVDSSVVAGLLARQGYEVIGITLQLYDHGAAIKRAGSCCAGQDIEDAKRVSEMLGIPHYVLDYERRFRDAVINPFMDSYIAGETPVPCISCNQTVKFADLLATARDLGADCLATGHYIRSEANGEHRALFRPVDAERDQSYFLFATTQDQLDYIRFPLGNMSKPEVRVLATEMGLIVAEKKDSQDICFVPQGKYADVIAKLKPQSGIAGRIVHMDGTDLGKHPGILHYTIGQRRGLGVAAAEPLYIVALDARTATVIVGPREALATHEIELRDMNWLGDTALSDLPAEGLALYARVRSTRAPKPAKLYWRNGKVSVVIEGGEDGVSPGQACVLYSSLGNDARVYGGGFIAASLRDGAAETAILSVLAHQRSKLDAKNAELLTV
jgi:tRNA-uridine 2-sulfurtransferase